MERTDVVIVGAGGGGAVLGLALAQKGIKSIVLEQAPGPPSGLRGEILQPNGQQILDRLGVLNKLPANATQSVRHFHFLRVGGERLCTVDYGMLPPPYNRAIVTLPNVAHHAILGALEQAAPGALRYGTAFKGLQRTEGRVTGVDVMRGGQPSGIEARLVVGADGAFSKVRDALGISAKLHLYPEGYLIALLENPDHLTESKYFVGKGEILGVFPAAGDKVYLFYMIPSDSMDRVKAAGIPALQKTFIRIDPSLEKTFRTLTDWKQTAYMPTGRVKTSRWVADGAVLIGDAAHAMNPHASQGRMQAMMDAMVLAELIPRWLDANDLSASALSEFERRRRPHVRMLQKLADEQVVFWNTANPLLAFLRDRVFRTLDHNARLRYRVLETTAGLRETAPFSLFGRLIAGGFLPDFLADQVEHG
jgi:2-polyprenyl-6-methoxyphenol hydroxylase-like FAD-dependent oxidoreductase